MVEYNTAIVLEAEPRRSANAEVADIDGDGSNEILLAIGRHWPGPNLLFRGDASGGFTTVDTLSNPQDRTYSLSVADMDGDGGLDMVVSNDRPDPNYVLLNDGTGQFTERVVFGDPSWPTRNSTVADLNLDGKPDVVVANRDTTSTGNNFVCLNNSDVMLALSCTSISSGPATTISVADINGDGNPDLVVPYRDVGQSRIYFGDGTGSFSGTVDFGPADASFRSAIALDLNTDNYLDLVAIDDRKNLTLAFLQTSDLQFEAGRQIDRGANRPYALDQADLNGDGRQDLLVGYRNAPSTAFFNLGDSLQNVSFGDSSGTTYGFGVGDIDNDGIVDIVSARSDASDVLFLGSHSN
ncbi:MAG: VCBS repeat-containing protein [Bacteroidota bacterium]